MARQINSGMLSDVLLAETVQGWPMGKPGVRELSLHRRKGLDYFHQLGYHDKS